MLFTPRSARTFPDRLFCNSQTIPSVYPSDFHSIGHQAFFRAPSFNLLLDKAVSFFQQWKITVLRVKQIVAILETQYQVLHQ